MRVRFGYVAMSVLLEKASPSRTVTVKTFEQLAAKSPDIALLKVHNAARENLQNTLRLLKHSRGYGISIYRFSSRLIPLATHPLLAEWDYTQDLKDDLLSIGDYVKANRMRVSFHPDHFTLLNSPRPEVLDASLSDLNYHNRMLDTMGLNETSKLVIHVGGGYKDKIAARARFLANWPAVPEDIQKRIVLENDDRIFTAGEVIEIARQAGTPVVLDLHHYACNRGEDTMSNIIPQFIKTWTPASLPPKIHISSPKSPEDFRSHHDYVNPDDIYPFLMAFADFNSDLDVMVEAKQKDQAMLRLVRDLGGYPHIRSNGLAELTI
ncbi:MAG: UV DNA damage repair endonuclease UvsE [Candidatus Saccharibacteria bacterium]